MYVHATQGRLLCGTKLSKRYPTKITIACLLDEGRLSLNNVQILLRIAFYK